MTIKKNLRKTNLESNRKIDFWENYEKFLYKNFITFIQIVRNYFNLKYLIKN